MKFPSPVSLEDLAKLTGARIVSRTNVAVSGINEIHKVEKGDITFVDHPKYYDKALESAASFVIINKEVEAPKGKALLYNDDPFSAYIKIVNRFRPFEASAKSISDSATIGEGTIIQP